MIAISKKIAGGSPAIIVDDVSKEFIIPHDRRTTLFENIKGIVNPNTYEKFTAIKDVSFTVNRGESVGIIGDNGSGKSTLLKIIANILRPSKGSVRVNGKITPFLELGVGFQPDLTAKENIEVYSSIMGLSDREISRNIDEVLEFAGLTNFRDVKLKSFSSGMQVRLAFSTAIQVKPDILLVDEVLAVGDMEFQQKCMDIFNEYKRSGVTILLVSHDLTTIRRFCDKTLLLKNGKLVSFDRTNEIVDRYVYGIDATQAHPATLFLSQTPSDGTVVADGNAEPQPSHDTFNEQQADRWGNGDVEITHVALIDKFNSESTRFNSNDPMTIRIYYHCKRRIQDVVFGISLYSESDIHCFGTNTATSGFDIPSIEGDGHLDIIIAELPIIAGKYMLTVAVHSKDHVPYDWHDKKYAFTVIPSGEAVGLFNIKCTWVLPNDGH